MRRIFFTKLILTVVTGLGLAGACIRFAAGLGASSNLSNAVPWGLWIGLDDMAGVALASGGFVITAIVYIFHLKKYNSLLRSAILTALLGYCLVPISLLLDIGLPWNIWHPLVYWQYHSILFAVSWCVMLLVAVFAVVFAITVLERPLPEVPFLQKAYRFLKRYMLIVVIIGIVISTLHQSALGSLFLIMPHRVHPLWYSPIIYVLYFISAVGLGCSVMIFESLVTSRLYGTTFEKDLLQGLGRASSIAILLYGLVRCFDLGMRHKLLMAFDGSWQSNLFLVEMTISTIIPILIFNVRRLRTSATWLFAGATLVVAGFILNRLCISFITMSKPDGASYFPSSIEIVTSLGMISAGTLIFFFCLEHLDLHEGKFLFRPARSDDITPSLQGQLHSLDRISFYSMALVLSVALGVACLYQNATNNRKYQPSPTGKAHALPDGATLRISTGNERIFVDFNHKAHQDSLGKKESCVKCHHMKIRENEVSPCYACHSDMYKEAAIFNHRRHEIFYQEKGSCRTCHPQERTALTFRPCKDCHPDMYPKKLVSAEMKFVAPAYLDAMHGSCIKCHMTEWKKRGKPTPDYCNTCHKDMESDIWKKKYGNLPTGIPAVGADSAVNKSMH
jgi:Ni/Fe-hydrogenase subunit HybB-like protein